MTAWLKSKKATDDVAAMKKTFDVLQTAILLGTSMDTSSTPGWKESRRHSMGIRS
jgi:hypothetical protein